MLRPPQGESMIGRQISHYIVKRKLGAGTYGVVYAAEHQADPELVVAIKVVQPSLIEEPRFVASLKAECRRLDKLDHRAIVRFRDLVVGEDMVAMILEHLDGQDLHSFIRAGAVPIERTVGILEACLDGLAYAHSRQVIHRDIKPSNIYVCHDGRIKLLDFGLARAAQGSQATQTGTLKGTLDYMAPERFSTEGGGAHSDVYALGLVAWELLVGRPACPDGDLAAKLGWHMGVGAPDVRTVRPDVPAWLAEVVQCLVAKDPADRPQDAKAAKALFAKQRATGRVANTPPPSAGGPASTGPGTVAFNEEDIAQALAGVASTDADEPDLEEEPDTDEVPREGVITVVPPDAATEARAPRPAPSTPPGGTDPVAKTAGQQGPRSLATPGVLGCLAVGLMGLAIVLLGGATGLWHAFGDSAWVQTKTCGTLASFADNCYAAGIKYETGGGVEAADRVRARELYSQACEDGQLEGCVRLGKMTQLGRGGLTIDHAGAVGLYRQACEGGSMNGCAALGYMYEDGLGGLEEDESKAAELYKLACDATNPAGCTGLGHLYYWGRGGLDEDEPKAVQLHKESCDQGNLRGCGQLGRMYFSGSGGLPENEPKAIELYQSSCPEVSIWVDGRDAYSCAQLASFYWSGRWGLPEDEPKSALLYGQACDAGGADACVKAADWLRYGKYTVEKNGAKAVSLYTQGCLRENMKSCALLGEMHQNGEGGLTKDPGRAVELYRQACERKGAWGCAGMGWMYETGGGGLTKDKSLAVAMYNKGCDGGAPGGCAGLGYMYYHGSGGVPEDERRSAELFTEACNDDHQRGCEGLGVLYFRGAGGLPEDDGRAGELFKKACEADWLKSCFYFGDINEKGRGPYDKDPLEALRLYKKACDGGIKRACEADLLVKHAQ